MADLTEEMRCATCDHWLFEHVRRDRAQCMFVMPPWATRGDDGDRYTSCNETCSFWQEREAS